MASLTELLPGDIDDPASQCSAHTPKFALTGEVQGMLCNDPGLPNGSVEAYQVNGYASYLKSWDSFNKWWGFGTSSTPGPTCPPGGQRPPDRGGDHELEHDNTSRRGRARCSSASGPAPAATRTSPPIVWTFPTENAFIVAWGGDNMAFSALDTWWANDVLPLASPTPVTPSP